MTITVTGEMKSEILNFCLFECVCEREKNEKITRESVAVWRDGNMGMTMIITLTMMMVFSVCGGESMMLHDEHENVYKIVK